MATKKQVFISQTSLIFFIVNLTCVLPVIAALLLPDPVYGQQHDQLPTDVETVVSGGLWQKGPEEGRFRVVIRSSGFEHVISTLTVDWISDPTESDSARIVASVPIPTTAVVVHDPELINEGGRWLLKAFTTDTHFDPPRRSSLRVVLGGPGVVAIQP